MYNPCLPLYKVCMQLDAAGRSVGADIMHYEGYTKAHAKDDFEHEGSPICVAARSGAPVEFVRFLVQTLKADPKQKNVSKKLRVTPRNPPHPS